MNLLLKMIFIPFGILVIIIVAFVIIALLTTKDYNPEDYFDL